MTLCTLEERIDEVIERKQGLSQQIIGTRENRLQKCLQTSLESYLRCDKIHWGSEVDGQMEGSLPKQADGQLNGGGEKQD